MAKNEISEVETLMILSISTKLCCHHQVFLDRIKAIAFTDSEHFIEPNNIQTQRGTLGDEQIRKLEDAAVHWRRMYAEDGSPEPVDTLEYELSDYHGCRVVSAGTNDHSSTNFMATPSIIRFFET